MAYIIIRLMGGGPRVVVSTAAFHARVRGSVPGLGGLKETKMFLPHPCVKVSIVGSLRDREVACSASDRQGSNSGLANCRYVAHQGDRQNAPRGYIARQEMTNIHVGRLHNKMVWMQSDPSPHSLHTVFVWCTY